MCTRLFLSTVARAIALLLSINAVASAQAPATPSVDQQMADANEALRSCVGFAEQRNNTQAEALGRRAETLFAARIAGQPRDVEALVGLARTQSQCLLPGADMMTQGELSAHAMELLESALAIDPQHWTARFILASINLRSPAFLGRAPRAAAEFDTLLRMQGERTDNPRFARVFEYRGALLNRAGQADSARAVWQHGSRLFPADSTLRGLTDRAAPEKTRAPSVEPKTPQGAPGGAARQTSEGPALT
ncbi:MAG: hypothetical protein ABI969_06595 [bacterium]